jgi:hypothetical protein
MLPFTQKVLFLLSKDLVQTPQIHIQSGLPQSDSNLPLE